MDSTIVPRQQQKRHSTVGTCLDMDVPTVSSGALSNAESHIPVAQSPQRHGAGGAARRAPAAGIIRTEYACGDLPSLIARAREALGGRLRELISDVLCPDDGSPDEGGRALSATDERLLHIGGPEMLRREVIARESRRRWMMGWGEGAVCSSAGGGAARKKNAAAVAGGMSPKKRTKGGAGEVVMVDEGGGGVTWGRQGVDGSQHDATAGLATLSRSEIVQLLSAVDSAVVAVFEDVLHRMPAGIKVASVEVPAASVELSSSPSAGYQHQTTHQGISPKAVPVKLSDPILKSGYAHLQRQEEEERRVFGEAMGESSSGTMQDESGWMSKAAAEVLGARAGKDPNVKAKALSIELTDTRRRLNEVTLAYNLLAGRLRRVHDSLDELRSTVLSQNVALKRALCDAKGLTVNDLQEKYLSNGDADVLIMVHEMRQLMEESAHLARDAVGTETTFMKQAAAGGPGLRGRDADVQGIGAHEDGGGEDSWMSESTQQVLRAAEGLGGSASELTLRLKVRVRDLEHKVLLLQQRNTALQTGTRDAHRQVDMMRREAEAQMLDANTLLEKHITDERVQRLARQRVVGVQTTTAEQLDAAVDAVATVAEAATQKGALEALEEEKSGGRVRDGSCQVVLLGAMKTRNSGTQTFNAMATFTAAAAAVAAGAGSRASVINIPSTSARVRSSSSAGSSARSSAPGAPPPFAAIQPHDDAGAVASTQYGQAGVALMEPLIAPSDAAGTAAVQGGDGTTIGSNSEPHPQHDGTPNANDTVDISSIEFIAPVGEGGYPCGGDQPKEGMKSGSSEAGGDQVRRASRAAAAPSPWELLGVPEHRRASSPGSHTAAPHAAGATPNATIVHSPRGVHGSRGGHDGAGRTDDTTAAALLHQHSMCPQDAHIFAAATTSISHLRYNKMQRKFHEATSWASGAYAHDAPVQRNRPQSAPLRRQDGGDQDPVNGASDTTQPVDVELVAVGFSGVDGTCKKAGGGSKGATRAGGSTAMTGGNCHKYTFTERTNSIHFAAKSVAGTKTTRGKGLRRGGGSGKSDGSRSRVEMEIDGQGTDLVRGVAHGTRSRRPATADIRGRRVVHVTAT